MKFNAELFDRYLPVFNSKNPSLVNTVQRLVLNTGLWSNQCFGVHNFAKIAIICFLSTNLTQLVALVMERNDPGRVFECFSVFSFCGMGALKFFNLYLNRERWMYMLAQVTLLESEQFRGISDMHGMEYDTEDEEEVVALHIERYTRDYLRISKLLVKLYSSTAVIFILTPFIEYSLQTDTKVYPHILPGWVPLDAVGYLGYSVNILFEVIASIYCVMIHVAFDCISVGIMIFICGQFSLLRQNTESIGGRGKNINLNAERDARAHLRLSKSHNTHISIHNVIDKLDTTLRSILGIYFFVASLTVCVVAVRLNSQRLSFMQLVSLLQYMCGTLTQLFLFCRYGDAVFHESSVGSSEGPFGSAWWRLSPRARGELSLLGAGMSQPRRLRAGPFNTLDLPSFVQIVRAAYSYYAVLGQTSKEMKQQIN